MMTIGMWEAILQFLEYENDRGKECFCHCGQCHGSYSYHRAYINSEGDFVLSQSTLQFLLEEYKSGKNFESGTDPSKHGYWYAKYWDAATRNGLSHEENRVRQLLVRKDYEEAVIFQNGVEEKELEDVQVNVQLEVKEQQYE